ncbi:hypothetical protein GCK72_021543 [Caenorhabditis remanei]|uniref:GATA-type domain-containing protein n=1 Tax=Caenorhabditis remanei TaxID=31234 RepID=A0A6A5GIG1_CAERE|nr:hypothetical protein GCK72_021543 [Caenorhabditis remanei]KAF1754977.1 hypothetical protein GCK72_021543 [Caenorhabditis remanei]
MTFDEWSDEEPSYPEEYSTRRSILEKIPTSYQYCQDFLNCDSLSGDDVRHESTSKVSMIDQENEESSIEKWSYQEPSYPEQYSNPKEFPSDDQTIIDNVNYCMGSFDQNMADDMVPESTSEPIDLQEYSVLAVSQDNTTPLDSVALSIRPVPIYPHQYSKYTQYPNQYSDASVLRSEISSEPNQETNIVEDCVSSDQIKNCYTHYRKYGRDRDESSRKPKAPPTTIYVSTKDPGICSVSVCTKAIRSFNPLYHPITRLKICQSCFNYYRKFGFDKTEEQFSELCTNCNLNPASKSHQITGAIVCPACYKYRQRTGCDRTNFSKSVPRKKSSEKIANQPPELCPICQINKTGAFHPSTRQRVCRTCYGYYRKHGKDRADFSRNKPYGKCKLVVVEQPKKQKKVPVMTEPAVCSIPVCKKFIPVGHGIKHPRTQLLICRSCFFFYKKYGVERTIQQVFDECTNCKISRKDRPHPKTGEPLCRACHTHYRRTGHDRVDFTKSKAYKRIHGVQVSKHVHFKSHINSPAPQLVFDVCAESIQKRKNTLIKKEKPQRRMRQIQEISDDEHIDSD